MVKRIACLIICIIVLSFSLAIPVFAIDPVPTPTPGYQFEGQDVEEALMSYYIWLCMRAWGIQISYQNSLEWQQEVNDEIVTWVLEYLDSLPSVYTINQWIAPWQSSFDYWGNYQFNNSALEDIQDFVDWLMTKFGVTDYSNVVLNPIYSVNGTYTLYEFGKWYEVSDELGTTRYVTFKAEQDSTYTPAGYCVAHVDNTYYYSVAIFYTGAENAKPYFQGQAIRNDDYVLNLGRVRLNMSAPNNNNLYTAWNNGFWFGTVENVIPFGDYWEGTSNQFQTFLDNLGIITIGDVRFVTEDVVLPYEDITYTNGDSITIVGENPQYSIIEWSGEVTVSNLPAIVSTGTVTNPGIVELFRPFSAIAESFAPAISTVTGIMYNLDENIVSYALAIIGITMLLGFIKIMRE